MVFAGGASQARELAMRDSSTMRQGVRAMKTGLEILALVFSTIC